MMKPPTYPLRPVNGGPLPKALPKDGAWTAEAKYNGWRAMVHAPTGTMFNRKNELLSIAGEFQPALAKLRHLGFDWLDCEGLERRHGVGRGSLVILDAPGPGTYTERRFALSVACAVAGIPTHKELNAPLPADSAVLAMSWVWQDASGNYAAGRLWDILKQCNGALGCEFFEGIVAKRNDSLYPFQLRSASQEFPFWMKHRWQF